MLGNLGLAALLEGRPAEAGAPFRAALEIDREPGYTEGLICGLFGLAVVLSDTGSAPDAAALLGAADAAASASAVELEPLELQVHTEVTERLTEALGATGFAAAHTTGATLGLDAAVERGLALSALVSTQ